MDMTDKIVLVTGSTDGLGRWTAQELALQGARVLVHGRIAERGARLVDAIEKTGGRAQFYAADFASLDEVRALADRILGDHDRLDVLINNAGVGGTGPRETSRDGVELRFAVNYLAGFLLTRRLLPLVPSGGRIINVTSVGQHPLDFDDLGMTRNYDSFRAYAQSKLAQILFTFDLADELRSSGILVNCLHPATFMDTTMVRAAGVRPLSRVDEGGRALLALLHAEGQTGGYYDQTRPARAHRQAYEALAIRRLREVSFQLTGLTRPETTTRN